MQLIYPDFYSEISLRIQKIRNNMLHGEKSALLIGANTNLYYSTGRFFRGYVYVPFTGEPVWFIIKPRIYEEEINVRFIRKPEEIPALLLEMAYPLPEIIGLEEMDLSYADIIRLKALFPEARLSDASLVLKKARMIKTEWEISEMKADGVHQTNVYSKIGECYHKGMSDLDLQIEIEKKLRLEGSLGVSRVAGNLMEINMGSVISGENADNPGPYEFTMGGSGVDPSLPVGADNSEILEGTTVMIDMNGAFNGYQTDMTRVWALGEIPSLAKKAHECSIEILRFLEKITVPGLPVKDMYQESLKIVNKYGLADFFMGHKSQVGFIGHGVGIELNEIPAITPKSKEMIRENMTLAIEPKFVIPHVGAVGVENTYVVRKQGLENITSFPESIQYF